MGVGFYETTYIMVVLEIKKFGCPVLRKKGAPVEVVTDETRKLIDEMFETMYAEEGIGLAAPQVGVSWRLVVLDVGPHDLSVKPMVLINPDVIWTAGEFVGEEGCLSLPGIAGDVKRPAQVRVSALDRDGSAFEVALDGIAAKAVQHEIDHLNGVLVVDHFSTIRRNLLRGQLRRLQREGKRQDPASRHVEKAGNNG
ncbi:MAG: peptide deformylase [bacterium]|nr:peptide deformylase [bacterium]